MRVVIEAAVELPPGTTADAAWSAKVHLGGEQLPTEVDDVRPELPAPSTTEGAAE